jgi:hypothetical protein
VTGNDRTNEDHQSIRQVQMNEKAVLLTHWLLALHVGAKGDREY